MPETYAAEPRTVLGKAVARLRREGVLPANIYGRGLDSTAVQIPAREVRSLLHEHGLNTLINLQVAGEAQTRPVVVRKVSRHPVSAVLEHIDFYQVDLSRPIQGRVNVVITGEAPAVQTYRALLLQSTESVLLEALPAAMPTHLELAVDGMTRSDAALTVADLKLPEGVSVLTPPEIVIVAISRGRGAGEGGDDELPEGEQEPEDEAVDEAAEGEDGESEASEE